MTRDQPKLKILIQPTNRMRFRYGSEKGSHGALTGSQDKKSFPTVRLENYIMEDKYVVVRASLYTNDKEPKLHVHRLKGPYCENGMCTVPVDKESMTAVFQNLSIEFVGKKEVTNVLYQRKKVVPHPIHANPEHYDDSIREAARAEGNKMNLNVVRMCFEALVKDPLTQNWHLLGQRTFSESISNQKATETGELKIVRMDKCSGCCSGGEEIFLLCDKVNKKDIQIQFYEEKNGLITWEGWGLFTEADVHYQVAIVFQTPPYRDQDISEPVNVFIRLCRKSDHETSEPKKFVYRPKKQDKEGVETKRRKVAYPSGHQPVEGISGLKTSPSSPYSTSSTSSGEFGTRRKSESGGTEGSLSEDPELIGNFVIENMASKYGNMELLDMESIESPLKDNSNDPLLASTSSFQQWWYNLSCNAVPSSLHSDSIPEGNELEDTMARLTIQENAFSKVAGKHLQFNKGHKDALESSKLFGRNVKNVILGRLQLVIEVCVHKFGCGILTELMKHTNLETVSMFLFRLQSFLLKGNENGENALHVAVLQEYENDEFLLKLVEVMKNVPGEGINSVNNTHQTPLHLAVICKRPSCMQYLLCAGADPGLKDENGDTALHVAASSGNKDCLQILLSFRSDKTELNELNYNGKAPLHLAVEKNNKDAVELLCEAGADVNVTDGKSGKTPLHYAAKGSSAIAEVLLKQGNIEVNLQDYGGNAPLHIACAHGLEDIVLKLIQNKADPLIENNSHDSEFCPDGDEAVLEEGKNAFYYASDNEKIMKLLNAKYENLVPSCSETSNGNMLKDGKPLSDGWSEDANVDKISSKSNTRIAERKNIVENTHLQLDSGYESREIHFLDNSLLKDLCCLLDRSNRWEKLAVFLVDTGMLNRFKSRKSPTKSMLRLHKGTFEEFVKMVELAELQDVLTLLQEHA